MAKFFLLNPGFELGDQDWFKFAGITIIDDVANARSGAWVATYSGSPAAQIRNLPHMPIRPGGKINVSSYIDSSGASAGSALVRASWRDKDDVEISASGGSSIGFGGSGYAQSVLTDSIAPDRAKFVGAEVIMLSSPAGTWYIDDFEATGDIIETLPTTAIISGHRIVPADTIGVFDPLIGADRFTEFNAGMSDKWAFVYTFIPSLGADLGELVSFIRRLGRTERLFAFDPDRVVPLNGIVNGMTVDGPITNGTNKISIKAGPVSSTALVAGDYMEVKGQYFQLQRNLEIGPEGTGEAIVWPAVRSTFADGEDIITDNPKMVARITSDLDWRRVEARPVEITISGEEV